MGTVIAPRWWKSEYKGDEWIREFKEKSETGTNFFKKLNFMSIFEVLRAKSPFRSRRDCPILNFMLFLS